MSEAVDRWTKRRQCECGETCPKWEEREESGRPQDCAGDVQCAKVDWGEDWSWAHGCETHPPPA